MKDQICGKKIDRELVDHLVHMDKGSYDYRTAALLAKVSAWAYSDDDSLKGTLDRYGIECNCINLKFDNDALLVISNAFLIQSKDGRLAILCFRGTPPLGIITWLSNLSAMMVPSRSAGRVHSGFFKSVMALWTPMSCLLMAAASGESICSVYETIRPQDSCAKERGSRPSPEAEPVSKLEALYITGHSLGGALAVLTAALLYSSSEYSELQRLLRGVYTFGQPMVGDKAFADHFQNEFGGKLFRHVYAKDIVPRLPSRTMGRFAHFGREYESTDMGWVLRPGSARQLLTVVPNLAIAGVAWLAQQLPMLRWLPAPVSLADHEPLNYLRMSHAFLAGAEFE